MLTREPSCRMHNFHSFMFEVWIFEKHSNCHWRWYFLLPLLKTAYVFVSQFWSTRPYLYNLITFDDLSLSFAWCLVLFFSFNRKHNNLYILSFGYSFAPSLHCVFLLIVRVQMCNRFLLNGAVVAFQFFFCFGCNGEMWIREFGLPWNWSKTRFNGLLCCKH